MVLLRMIKMKKILYAKDSKNRIKEWQISVEFPATIVVESGLHGGKHSIKKTVIKSGKNLGRKNATTPYEQAVAEALSRYKKKLDEDYCATIKEAKALESCLPMLAHKFIERKHRLKYPIIAQRKYDGIRCMVKKLNDGTLSFRSRTGKNFGQVLSNHTELIKSLNNIMKPGDILDGELYNHDWSLQRIGSAVKALNPDTTNLTFVVFDFPSAPGTFLARYSLIHLHYIFCLPIAIAEIYTITKEEEIHTLHDQFVKEGYEGIILRNNAEYQYGARSNDLQKYKKFIDKEFEIVGTYKEVQIINGTQYECIEFNCVTKDGGLFNCRPKGSLALRQKWWKDRDSFIGKQLTVRYFALTDDTQGKGKKVPQFPVGVAIRDYE